MTAPVPAGEPGRPGRYAGLHPLLLAAYAVLFLWSQNLGETDAGQVVLPLVVVVLGAALLTLALGAVLGDRRRGALVAAPIVVGFLMYDHVANLASVVGVPGVVQQAAWIALVIVAIAAAIRLDTARIAILDRLLGSVAGLLVVVTLALIVPHQASAMTTATGRAPAREPIATTTDARKRDVYWLVFDRYGSDRAIELRYGVANDLSPWLRQQGFTVLPDSHANYIRTVLSVATTLNMAHLSDLLPDQSSDSTDLGAVNATLQDPLVARQFKALGYRYHHIGSWWDPTRADGGADVNHLPPSVLPVGGDLTATLFDESAIPAIARRLGVAAETAERRHATYGAFELDALEGLREEPGPKFVLAHILLPHGPNVFDRDGSFLGDAEAGALGLSSLERYRRQLDFTNTRLREILGGLLTLPEERRPIVIFQADEGPWPVEYTAERKATDDWAERASEEDLEEKYGIMNAWYVPGDDDLGLDRALTAINTFPLLFDRYFGIPYPMLPDVAYASRDWYHPYALTDITARLPSLR